MGYSGASKPGLAVAIAFDSTAAQILQNLEDKFVGESSPDMRSNRPAVSSNRNSNRVSAAGLEQNPVGDRISLRFQFVQGETER
jgi:hypothetical protein